MKSSSCSSVSSLAAAAAILLFLSVPASAQHPLVVVPLQTTATRSNAASDPAPGPIAQPEIVSIAYNTYLINEFDVDNQYLLIGKDRALLIDTGTGFYDIKATVEKLTSLPYDVVITHGHPDHVGMIGAFDAVYMGNSAADRSRVADDQVQKGGGTDKEQRKPHDKNSPNGGPSVVCGYWNYSPVHFDKRPTVNELHDGQTFDLGGGRVITAYYVPGHTIDSYAFLDRKTRILFSGDTFLPTVDIRGVAPVAASTRLRSWIKIENLGAEYDRIFYGHAVSGCSVDVKPMNPAILGNLIEIYRQALSGQTSFKTIEDPANPSRYRAVWKNAEADVETGNLWEIGETHIVP